MPRWDLMTSTEIGALLGAGMDLAVLPVGATEQHGPHLACGCDTVSAETLAELAAERAGGIVLPGLPYGCSLGHTDKWPGTLSLHPMTLTQVVLELGRWLAANGFKRVLLLSGHATNGPSLQSAILQLRYEFPESRYATMGLWEISKRVGALYTRDGDDIHANRGETSILLHLRPEMVRAAAAEDVPDVTPGRVFSYPMPATTPNGVVGRPSEASARDGAAMVETIVEDLAAWIERALAEDWPAVPEARGRATT
ncbi:creatinine amidohydrolase [Tistlia consotensis]|uniref:Creatinine amidohydrolase n=1 Tax=Tistlia consotensis USBA 355 TaxID=560819 RepID=A0A1Y6C454_9PROT|nr:creatininase family protein [Tistlia consotensis]SMF36122.1 creatinine amidohydrolase [Tistlia consotensis USBA 355]SNR71462.1 creatinine amidohydrolase [Tistlia consotensis]